MDFDSTPLHAQALGMMLVLIGLAVMVGFIFS
jgi:hypothetical protein